MSEQKSDLQDQLEKLDAELKRTPAADETQRQHLEAMQAHVRTLLERSGENPTAHDPSIFEALRSGLQHFEATHPALAGLIEQVLSTLSAAGI